jgi:glycosyltransferase involved in cell wall biosynthesis
MQHSEIFLFPSMEGAGMVVLEAIANGLPVVCLNYGGSLTMVTNSCGIKVSVAEK